MIHPVTFAIISLVLSIYCFLSDLLESHLNWEPQTNLPLLERIGKVAEGRLAERELAYLGAESSGGYYERIEALIVHILTQQELKWKGVYNLETIFRGSSHYAR